MSSALLSGANAMILAHNHPSGNLTPSNADKQVTNKIKKAAALLEIQLLDHLVISDEGYYSLADEGLL
jgi:DNA repair protein RadC